MGLDLNYIDGQTPIDEDEIVGLLIETITTRAELDEFEQLNIEEAIQWSIGRKLNAEDVFTNEFICNLHKRMFGQVWTWAGKFRNTDKNIGIDKYQISAQLKTLCDDALFWIEDHTYSPDEIALGFKHRLVSIHCFPNGNGRHSRLMSDIIIEKIFGREVFTWGGANLSDKGVSRSAYLRAVKTADKGNICPLIVFARS